MQVSSHLYAMADLPSKEETLPPKEKKRLGGFKRRSGRYKEAFHLP
jgi:hypothetical protein